MPIFFDNDSIALSDLWPTNAFNHPVFFAPMRSSLLNTRGAVGAYASNSQTPQGGVMVDGPVFDDLKGLRLVGGYEQLYPTPTSPQNETISLSTGSYTLRVEGTSVAVAAGTATIASAGTATEGSPHTFVVDVGGTCTFTVTVATRVNLTESTYPLPWMSVAAIKSTEAGNSDGTGVSWKFSDMSEKAWDCFRGKTDGVELLPNLDTFAVIDAGDSTGYISGTTFGNSTVGTNITYPRFRFSLSEAATATETYRVKGRISGDIESIVQVRLATAGTDQDVDIDGNGRFEEDVTGTSSGIFEIGTNGTGTFECKLEEHSVQKVLSAQGSIFIDVTFGFSQGDLSDGDYNIISQQDSGSGLLSFTHAATSLISATDGTNTATTEITPVAGQTYLIGLHYGLLEGAEKLQVSVDSTWGDAVPFTGWDLEDYLRLAYGNEELQNLKNPRLYDTPGSLVNGAFVPL